MATQSRARRVFIKRGLASAKRARTIGKYVPARTVLRKLSRRLELARGKVSATVRKTVKDYRRTVKS